VSGPAWFAFSVISFLAERISLSAPSARESHHLDLPIITGSVLVALKPPVGRAILAALLAAGD